MCQGNKKKCGGCAFMLYEDTYGYGSCPFDFGELKHCDMDACQHHIDRDKVRHSAVILARFKRAVHNWDEKVVSIRPKESEIDEAIDIVTRYVNVITKEV